jgi:rod shape-determining protein MreD
MIKRYHLSIFITLVIALMLSMLPLPDWAIYARPDWVSLVMIYWAMALPKNASVGLAFTFGLLLDVSLGTLLGLHALGLVVVTFMVQRLYMRIRVYTMIQQALFIGLLLTIKQLIVLWVNGMIDNAQVTAWYLLPALTGAIVWPWLFIILRDIRRRFCQIDRH